MNFIYNFNNIPLNETVLCLNAVGIAAVMVIAIAKTAAALEWKQKKKGLEGSLMNQQPINPNLGILDIAR